MYFKLYLSEDEYSKYEEYINKVLDAYFTKSNDRITKLNRLVNIRYYRKQYQKLINLELQREKEAISKV